MFAELKNAIAVLASQCGYSESEQFVQLSLKELDAAESRIAKLEEKLARVSNRPRSRMGPTSNNYPAQANNCRGQMCDGDCNDTSCDADK